MLLANIKNTPQLENLTIELAPVDLAYLEQLHDSVPRLKVLSLASICGDRRQEV